MKQPVVQHFARPPQKSGYPDSPQSPKRVKSNSRALSDDFSIRIRTTRFINDLGVSVVLNRNQPGQPTESPNHLTRSPPAPAAPDASTPSPGAGTRSPRTSPGAPRPSAAAAAARPLRSPARTARSSGGPARAGCCIEDTSPAPAGGLSSAGARSSNASTAESPADRPPPAILLRLVLALCSPDGAAPAGQASSGLLPDFLREVL